jgi:hypothetical protein
MGHGPQNLLEVGRDRAAGVAPLAVVERDARVIGHHRVQCSRHFVAFSPAIVAAS